MSMLRVGDIERVERSSAFASVGAFFSGLLRDLAPKEKTPAKSDQPHRVISFLGTSGGVGNTTMAMETGVFLASQQPDSGRNVALFDLDFSNSLVCDYLDLEPQLNLAEIARNPGRLDNFMVDIFTAKHSSGLDVLATRECSAGRAPPDMQAEFELLNKLHDIYNFILIDAPFACGAMPEEILQNSDLVFVTGLYSVPSVKQVCRQLKRLRELDIPRDRTVVVLTDAEQNLFFGAAGRFDIGRSFSDVRVLCIRRDRSFALESVDAGVSMMQARPGRGICRDIGKIGEMIQRVAISTPVE
jgi:pilus assembly protein CpaE